MNCKEAERKIYLYGELTTHEREETDRHIETCAACRQLSARVIQEREMLREILHPPQPVPDPVLLTQQIMSGIEKTRTGKVSALDALSSLIFSKPLRYGMTALSLLLVVVFINEHNAKPVLQKTSIEAGDKVRLNSASFRQALKEREENPQRSSAVYECVMSCLQAQDADCSECRVRFANLIKNHETI